MYQAFHLFRIQQIDSQIDQAETSLADINRRLEGDEAVRQAIESTEQAGKALQQARQALKTTEFAVQEQQIKIQQIESTLYGGLVRNPKELQDLQKDILSLKKHLSTLEDRQLDAMMTVEQAESNDEAARTLLNKAQAAFAEKSAGWLGQKDILVRNLDRLRSERNAGLTLVSADALRIYEQLRKRKSGLAVTMVKEGSCSGCGATIRPSEVQAVRASQDLSYCASCGRILYAG